MGIVWVSGNSIRPLQRQAKILQKSLQRWAHSNLDRELRRHDKSQAALPSNRELITTLPTDEDLTQMCCSTNAFDLEMVIQRWIDCGVPTGDDQFRALARMCSAACCTLDQLTSKSVYILLPLYSVTLICAACAQVDYHLLNLQVHATSCAVLLITYSIVQCANSTLWCCRKVQCMQTCLRRFCKDFGWSPKACWTLNLLRCAQMLSILI